MDSEVNLYSERAAAYRSACTRLGSLALALDRCKMQFAPNDWASCTTCLTRRHEAFLKRAATFPLTALRAECLFGRWKFAPTQVGLGARSLATARALWLLDLGHTLIAVHGPSPQAQGFVDQLSHPFCRDSLSFLSLRVTCGDPPLLFLVPLQSVLIVATASWLNVKETIVSLW